MPLRGDDIIGLFSILLVMAIPIVAILTSHQRKMAELFRRDQPQNVDNQAQLMREMYDLKQLVQRQVIAIDDLSQKVALLSAESSMALLERTQERSESIGS